MTRAILGIDPGLSGALALYWPSSGVVAVRDMPVLETRRSDKRIKRSVDPYELARLIDEWSKDIGLVCLELVGVRPGEGAVGAFSFGEGYGLVRGVCCANFLPVETVTPASWKRAMGVKGDKDESRARASQLFPRSAGLWPRKKDDGRAESLLIAAYGARFLQEAHSQEAHP